MGAAWTELKTFWDNVQLRQLTNVNTPGASSINETVGLKAEAVAQKLFQRVVGVAPVLSDADHQAVLFTTMVYLLELWGNKLGDTWKERKQQVMEDLQQLRDVTARKRVTAKTSSSLDPTDDTVDGTISSPKPAFDLKRFFPTTPNDPLGQPFIPDNLNS